MVPQQQKAKRLHLKGIINNKNYRTAIGFTTVATNISMYLPYKDTDPIIYKRIVSNQNQKTIICMMGIIIKGVEKVNNKPFFLIERVWFEN